MAKVVESTCLASAKPCFQTLLPQKKISPTKEIVDQAECYI
jgi:hypothetical protein